MAKYLSNNSEIKQWFLDMTYYTKPWKNNNFKLLLLTAFNLRTNKTILGGIFLIKNENQETFIGLFKILKIKYNYNPRIINVDCNITEILAIKKTFMECDITIRYYYIIKRIVQYIPELRSKKENLKEKAQNMLDNIKIYFIIY